MAKSRKARNTRTKSRKMRKRGGTNCGNCPNCGSSNVRFVEYSAPQESYCQCRKCASWWNYKHRGQ